MIFDFVDFSPTIQALRGSNPPSANFFRLLCSVNLKQKVRGIFTLKTQKTGPGAVSLTIPEPVFSGFTVFWAIFTLKTRKLPDLSGRQIRQLIWLREKDLNQRPSGYEDLFALVVSSRILQKTLENTDFFASLLFAFSRLLTPFEVSSFHKSSTNFC